MSNSSIMVVEDESVVARDIRNSLLNMGYRVPAAASSGADAVARAGELRPDLVLMDIMLRGEMDGIQAANLIRSRFDIPVVYLTAYTDEETLGRAKVSDAFGYLLKPFDDKELRIAIEMALYKHQMERRLQESETWLKTTLNCIADGVAATDSEFRVRLFNAAAERASGWAAGDALGRPLSEVLPLVRDNALLDVASIVSKADGDGPLFSTENEMLLKPRSGPDLAVSVSAAPIRGEQGRRIGLVLVFRDITEIKKANAREREMHERLIRSKRMESIGMLAGGIAHDLNNILGPIVGYPDLIAGQLPKSSPIRQDLDIIRNSAHKAVEIVRDLLTLGRAGRYPMEPVALDAIVESARQSGSVRLLREKKPMVDVEFNLQHGAPAILGSAQHLAQMVICLVTNVYDTMPESGKILLSTSEVHLSESMPGIFETIERGDYVALEVFGAGSCIDLDDLSRIFEPFIIRKGIGSSVGSGLGLAVVYGVVKDHKGFLDVRMEQGKGTSFKLYFPVCGRPAAGSPQSNSNCRGNETVLVVDDDEEQRRFTARALGALGYRVLTANNGRASLDVFEKELRAGRPVALVLLDMIMADDFDGLATYQKMLELRPGQKAIVLSGFTITDRIKEAMSEGVGEFIQKPFNIEELGEAVRRELDRKPDAGGQG